jgi:O-acetylhomoserine/O-acetylserine sulfhydrylase
MNKYHFETNQVHAGRYIESQGSCVTPIHQTSSFIFKSTEHAANLFQLKEEGHIYSRMSNPTVDTFEKRIASLEEGSAALAVSSGLASQFIAIQNIAQNGDNIISSPSLYGGSYAQFKSSFRKFGIEFRFADKRDYSSYEKAINKKTKAIFIETIGNSDFYIPDFDRLVEICNKYKIPLVVDNTFGCGGYLFKPINYGANIITHAATKWIGGHGNSIAGVIIDGGNFNWGNGKFPAFTEPSESYHGLKFWDAFGKDPDSKNIAFAIKARVEGLRDWGCCLSPFNAFLLLQGIETLSLRCERMFANAYELAGWLQRAPKVESVNYPGLKENENYPNAIKYFKNKGFGSVLTFTVKGDKLSTAKFVERLQLITHLVNVGDNKTLISHSASTTHGQLSPNALAAAGIGENMLRLSVGIENIEDIKADLDQALKTL